MHIRDISFTTSTLYVCLFQPKSIRLQTKETNLMKTILQVQQHRVGGEQGEEGDRGRQGGAGIQLHEGQPGTVPFSIYLSAVVSLCSLLYLSFTFGESLGIFIFL